MSVDRGKKRPREEEEKEEVSAEMAAALAQAEAEADAEAEAAITGAEQKEQDDTETQAVVDNMIDSISSEPTTNTSTVTSAFAASLLADPSHPSHFTDDALEHDMKLRTRLQKQWSEQEKQYNQAMQQAATIENALPNQIKYAKGKVTRAKKQYQQDPTPEAQAAIVEATQALTHLEQQLITATQHRQQVKAEFRAWFYPRQVWRKRWKEQQQAQAQPPSKKQRRSPSPIRTRQHTHEQEAAQEREKMSKQAAKYGIAAAHNELEEQKLQSLFHRYGPLNKIKPHDKDKLALEWALEQAQAAIRVAEMTEAMAKAQARLDRTESEDRIRPLQNAIQSRRQKLEHDVAKQNVRSRIMAAWCAKGWVPPSERPVSEAVAAATSSSASSHTWKATSTDPTTRAEATTTFTGSKKKKKHKKKHRDKDKHHDNKPHQHKHKHNKHAHNSTPHKSNHNGPSVEQLQDQEQPGAPT